MDFWEIYDQYYAQVKKYVAAMTRDDWAADDILQEVFMKVQRKFETLDDWAKLKPWIYSIARNQCFDHFRKVSASKENQTGDDREIDGIQPPLIQLQLERREMSRCVQNKIDLLPDSKREVIILFDALGLSHQEVSDILGIQIGAVKVRLHRARKARKEILDKDCNFEHDERNVFVCSPIEDEF
jgi:RNA polymerase sigma-70 factor, ECF subfamily